MSIVESLGMSLLGMLTVFVVLIILMISITIMAAVMRSSRKRKELQAAAIAAAPAQSVQLQTAPGSCGDVRLFDASDSTAAMIMAIIADELGTPLNQLRFVTIKEAEDNGK